LVIYQFGTSCIGDQGLGYVTTAVTDRVYGHHREKSILVRHVTFNGDEPRIDFEQLEEAIPAKMTGSVGQGDYEETVKGTPVTAEKEDVSTMGGGSEYYYDYDYSGKGTPCGAQVEVKYGGESTSEMEFHMGTVACPAWHGSHGSVMLTACHVVDDNLEGYEVEDIFNPDHPDNPYNSGGTRGDTLDKEWASSDTKCSNRPNDSAIAEFDDGYSYKFELDATTGGGDSGGPIFTETYHESGTSFKSVAGIVSYGGSNLTGAPHIGNAESAMNVSI
jgi:hypothetical protein